MPSQAPFFLVAGFCEVGLFMSASPINAIMLRTARSTCGRARWPWGSSRCHLLGDLWSPPLVGLFIDSLPIVLAMMALPVAFAIAPRRGGRGHARRCDMSIRDVTTLGETAPRRATGRCRATRCSRSGHIFRGLKIRALLGSGGMGNAYLASHASLRTPVVVKTFRHDGGMEPLAEEHLAARVVSSSVVPVLDAGVEDGVPYVMMRYVDGNRPRGAARDPPARRARPSRCRC